MEIKHSHERKRMGYNKNKMKLTNFSERQFERL